VFRSLLSKYSEGDSYGKRIEKEISENFNQKIGWSLKKVILKDPLILSPFGGGNECFFNIVGDHLGQGYHQYIFNNKWYPKK
jgi:hypothetical protein